MKKPLIIGIPLTIIIILGLIGIFSYPVINSVITTGQLNVAPSIIVTETGENYIKGEVHNLYGGWSSKANQDVRFWTLNTLYLNDEVQGHFHEEYIEPPRGKSNDYVFDFEITGLNAEVYNLKLKTLHLKEENDWEGGDKDVDNPSCEGGEYTIPVSHHALSERVYRYLECGYFEYGKENPVLQADHDYFTFIEERMGDEDKSGRYFHENQVKITIGGEVEEVEVEEEEEEEPPKPEINWMLIGGITAGIIVLGGLIWLIIVVKRRK